jgi:hypothetical protein
MTYEYISIVATTLSVLGYIPEIYNLSYSLFYNTIYKPHSSKVIWFIWISSSILSFIYGIVIEDYYIATYGGMNTLLNVSVFSLHTIKEYKSINNDYTMNTSNTTSIDTSNIDTSSDIIDTSIIDTTSIDTSNIDNL